mmetsp:Transcript_25111/g.65510  ORF Transcript_25111/g.65510 Transcript_25111/m.65510 type:complete len:106 (-) Transcript_25111:353-670(-)
MASNADNIPSGTYQGSCGGCVFDETTRVLSCEQCVNQNGDRVPTDIDATQCDGMDITNSNGDLACAEVADDGGSDAGAASRSTADGLDNVVSDDSGSGGDGRTEL